MHKVIHVESQNPSPSPSRESSPPLSRLFIQDFIPDPLLTEALHNPHLLFHPGGSAQHIGLSFADADDQSIIVIKRTLDKTKTAWLLTSLLLLSPALGLVIGLCSHDAEVGIAISAGVFALATFVQGLVAWVQG